MAEASSSTSRSCPSCGFEIGDSDSVSVLEAGLDSLAADLKEAFADGAVLIAAPVGNTAAFQLPAKRSKSEHPLPIDHLGDFKLIEELGRGGMGIVYRAVQESLGRHVALKVLHASSRPSARMVSRFLRESQAAGKLHHTNIVPVYAQGEEGGNFYYAMELIEGPSLDVAMRSHSSATSLTFDQSSFSFGSLGASGSSASRSTASGDGSQSAATALPRKAGDYRRIAALMAEVCDGIAHAHAAGIIHRDIKPQNLLLGSDNHIHITDFGLAKGFEDTQLTLDGELMGTLAYMSPEQTGGTQAAVDHRTDVYSLGVTLYEVLTLSKPFAAKSREQLLQKIAIATPPFPRRIDPRIPPDLETICLRAMEKEPFRRYYAASDMALELRRFAEDRPIHTRRAGLIERGWKWVRRRKALAAAIGFLLLATSLGTALAASVASGRRQEASHCLQRAYEQLVYRNYAKPELVAVDLDRARRYGAQTTAMLRVEALEALGRLDYQTAIQHLNSILDHHPNDMEARYTLAWAHVRNNETARGSTLVREADQLGGPSSAADWFFRGLAIHRENPIDAAECYRKAREAAGAAQQFFPQATLNLARSYNQQMYQSRRIERLSETVGMLRELVDYGIYGSKPHYLLSISHRLAAEVYEDSGGTRGEAADEHYRLALDWAAKGQALGPQEAEGPLTAAAECYESMKNYPAAIDARSAAIELAEKEEYRLEGLGYRWRLRYWTGDFEGAMADLDLLQQLDPACPFFARFYPMLIHAEAGRLDEAVALALDIYDSKPGDAQSWYWSVSALRILGREDLVEARLQAEPADLSFDAGLVAPQTEAWVRDMVEFVAGRASIKELLESAARSPSPWKLTGEVQFHEAARHLAEGRRGQAFDAFDAAFRSFDNQRRYTFHAKLFRVKMQLDPQWPSWLRFEGGS